MGAGSMRSKRGGGAREQTLNSFTRGPDSRTSLTDTHALSQRAAVVTADHRGMDVAFAADCGGIAKLLRDALNNLELALLCRFFFFQSAKRDYGQIGSGPGTKVLGSDFSSGDF